MKNLNLALTATFLSASAFCGATELQATGARYAAQGDVLVSAATDSYAIAINPANLVAHTFPDGISRVSEVTTNLVHFDSESPVRSDNINMVGGFMAYEKVAFGASISTSAGSDTLASETENSPGTETRQMSFATAFGNGVEGDNYLTYGIGAVINMV